MPLLRAVLLLLSVVLLPLTAAAAVPVWGRWELALTATMSASPETDVSVELTAPSGKAQAVSGFWDGDATWRVRAMPDEAGTWRYRTRSRPAREGLDGVQGEFVAEAGRGETPFLRHGAVRVAASGRFFEHADRTPFFWLGDTAWYGAILGSAGDWSTYLADRAGKRFSVVHFNVVAPRNGVAVDEHGEISFSHGLGLLRPKALVDRLVIKALTLGRLYAEPPIRMNPRFYQRLDARIDAVNAHGLLAAIVCTWALGPLDSGNALPEAEVVRVIRYLQARYGAHHVVWVMTGDADYEGAAAERWRRIGRAAFGGRTHRPVTTHPGGMRWPWEAFRAEPWLDFIVYQSGHGDDAATLRWLHSGPPRQYWRDAPPRPLINLEPPYEGHRAYQSGRPHTDYTTRRAIYWSLLNAPTAGVTYGAHGVWSWHTVAGQPPTDHPHTGVAKTWREALSLPGSGQMTHLHDFFAPLAWWTLRPDDTLLAEQPGAADPSRWVAASRSDDGALAVLYLPAGGAVQVKDGRPDERRRAQWFDPRAGRWLAARATSPGAYEAPDGRDWLLLVRER